MAVSVWVVRLSLWIFAPFIGVWLMINCFGYVALSVIALFASVYYNAAFSASQPVLFGELAIMLWLLIKGAKVPLARSQSRQCQ